MHSLFDWISSEPKLGVLALGGFVGWLLGFGLANSRRGLRAAITVLGAALGGGPVLFMADAGDAKWWYPVGLLLGLLATRAMEARVAIARKYGRPSKEEVVHGWFAWLDLLVIFGSISAALIYVLISP